MNTQKKLTDEQKALIEIYREECYQKGISTKPINRDILVENITRLYEIKGVTVPEFHFADSINHAQYIINALDKGVPVESVKKLDFYEETYMVGQQDYYWIAFYEFGKNHLGVKYKKENDVRLEIFKNLGDYGHWIWMFTEACVISERPTELHFKDKKLHNSEGPAVLYKDGYAQYYIDGVKPDEEKIEELMSRERAIVLIKEAMA